MKEILITNSGLISSVASGIIIGLVVGSLVTALYIKHKKSAS